jgi:hypothetical protein
MARIDAETLLPNEHVMQAVGNGEMTQMHRGQAYADVGDTFTVDGLEFEITEVEERQLGDLTDEDARAEGSQDLDAYRERLDRAHEHFEWDDAADVVRHRFAPADR